MGTQPIWKSTGRLADAPRLAQMVAQAEAYARTHDGRSLFDDLVAAELRAGTRIVVLRRFDALFGKPAPHIAAWYQAPVRDPAARGGIPAHLQVLSVQRAAGKLKYLAGTESGMGVWINDIIPEEAAQRLREAL